MGTCTVDWGPLKAACSRAWLRFSQMHVLMPAWVVMTGTTCQHVGGAMIWCFSAACRLSAIVRKYGMFAPLLTALSRCCLLVVFETAQLSVSALRVQLLERETADAREPIHLSNRCDCLPRRTWVSLAGCMHTYQRMFQGGLGADQDDAYITSVIDPLLQWEAACSTT